MRYLLIPLLLLLIVIFTFAGCSKSANNYSVTDHTVGMSNPRLWSGITYGYAYGDTLWDTVHVTWPEYFSGTTTDTSFPILKINGFAISVLGKVLIFRSVDSVTKMVRYDSTYANSAPSFLIWDFGKDTMHFEFHKIYGYNDTPKKYYETNQILHSH